MPSTMRMQTSEIAKLVASALGRVTVILVIAFVGSFFLPPPHRWLARLIAVAAFWGLVSAVATLGRHVVGVEMTPGRGIAMHATLVVDGAVAAAAEIPRTTPFRFTLHGEGLCCGYDDGTPVARAYASPFRFTGELLDVTIDVSGTPVVDHVAEVRRAWMVE